MLCPCLHVDLQRDEGWPHGPGFPESSQQERRHCSHRGHEWDLQRRNPTFNLWLELQQRPLIFLKLPDILLTFWPSCCFFNFRTGALRLHKLHQHSSGGGSWLFALCAHQPQHRGSVQSRGGWHSALVNVPQSSLLAGLKTLLKVICFFFLTLVCDPANSSTFLCRIPSMKEPSTRRNSPLSPHRWGCALKVHMLF